VQERFVEPGAIRENDKNKDTDRETALAAGAYDQTMWNSLRHADTNSSLLLPGVPATSYAPHRRYTKASGYRIHFGAKDIPSAGANHGPHDIHDVSCHPLTSNATLGPDLLAALDPADAGNCGIVVATAAKTFEHLEVGCVQQARRIPPVQQHHGS
jgi:hypothetical protein